ncbi:hypothetical protein EW146_g5658 [Bondarzewia mesenterica]|uniref:SRR1-like domain-containing protein n=1 Tax=Bondarzewia mesenterica TaxID=1095465 RepID=A0A4S4LQU1_9AGAM|nr:hypothetical protein EW146_g5658 [Bondarzewia mesenterica]
MHAIDRLALQASDLRYIVATFNDMTSAVESSASFQYTDSFKPSGPRKKRRNNNKPVVPHTPPYDLYIRCSQEVQTGSWLEECHRSSPADPPDLPIFMVMVSPAGLTKEALKEASFSSPHVLCLGLGCPAASRDARSQLAFLLETCDHLSFDRGKVAVYDPAFTPKDVNLLIKLNRGKHRVEAPTILFMPHCDVQLYENLLRENWTAERLSNLFLICNLLSEYLDSNPSHKVAAQFPCLARLAPRLLARRLPTGAPHATAFTSLAIQFVPAQSLPARTDTSFWELPPITTADALGESNSGCLS